MANNLSGFDSMTARKLVSFISDNLRTVSDTLQRIYIMANTGSPFFMKDMEKIILNETVSLQYRVRAVEVIKNIHSENTIAF
jgi:hypothetical protein